MKAKLTEGIFKVVFTKVDGSERTMLCTLKPDLLPEVQTSKSEEKRTEALSALRVFDLEKKDWRAFRVDAVKSFEAQ